MVTVRCWWPKFGFIGQASSSELSRGAGLVFCLCCVRRPDCDYLDRIRLIASITQFFQGTSA